MNRLSQEASPYLQQHATNPVDWYPWGPEALGRAKELDRPILLSIGYSACHWCHVMEHESFANAATAALMNERFVCIKVDREERPDLDQVYQLAVQLTGRSGGWPLTAFLAPDGRPFFAGTYFPPKERYGMPGFPAVLEAVSTAYQTQRAEIHEQAAKMTAALAQATAAARKATGADDNGTADDALGPDFLAHAVEQVSRRFDDVNGGFGTRPKFPNTMALSLLLRSGTLDRDEAAGHRALRALRAMSSGGIHDQLGGGFHRYSTDEIWLVPHFEKMLYDNALLLELYADAFAARKRAEDREVAVGIVEYLAREMTGADGAFYATQDADSEGHEGKFFVWKEEEIRGALPDDALAADVAVACFGVTEEGNFEEPGEPKTGASVLSRAVTATEPEEIAAFARARARLFVIREMRPKPFRDEKVIASWNGLMIRALAHMREERSGEPSWVARAEKAFATVTSRLSSRDERGVRLQRLYKGDVVRGPGFLDDYSYLAAAALELYEATGKPEYVTRARELAEAMVARFGARDGDGDGGGEESGADDGRLFFTPADGESLIHRSRDPYDQAVPSAAAAVAYEVFLRLGSLLGGDWAGRAALALESLAEGALKMPLAQGHAVGVIDRLVRGAVEIVLVGPHGDPSLAELAKAALSVHVPNRVVAWLDPADAESRAACAALAEGKVDTNASKVPRRLRVPGRDLLVAGDDRGGADDAPHGFVARSSASNWRSAFVTSSRVTKRARSAKSRAGKKRLATRSMYAPWASSKTVKAPFRNIHTSGTPRPA